jgi:hypothetical protein
MKPAFSSKTLKRKNMERKNLKRKHEINLKIVKLIRISEWKENLKQECIPRISVIII